LSFVIASYDGFTRNLHDYAVKNPGAQLRASIDGPYGNIPDFTKFDKLVLIAGGSGGSFTFGVAIDTIRRLGKDSTMVIDLVWVVREQGMCNFKITKTTSLISSIDCISWFSNELDELIASHVVNLHIHSTRNTLAVTRKTNSIIDDNSSSSTIDVQQGEKTPLPPVDPVIVAETGCGNIDSEKQLQTAVRGSVPRTLTIEAGRPDIAKIIETVLGASASHENVAIAACGPDSMMSVVRKTVANGITASGPSVELHCEQFEW